VKHIHCHIERKYKCIFCSEKQKNNKCVCVRSTHTKAIATTTIPQDIQAVWQEAIWIGSKVVITQFPNGVSLRKMVVQPWIHHSSQFHLQQQWLLIRNMFFYCFIPYPGLVFVCFIWKWFTTKCIFCLCVCATKQVWLE
jgi:hypothetical protein